MPPKYYWDACVILEYLNQSPSRAPDVNALLDSADKGEIQIFTSTLSIAEVAFAAEDRNAGALSKETEDKIDKLWAIGSPIQLVEFHRIIAEDARDISRSAMAQGIGGMGSVDKMHLATAMRIEADEVHTYEAESTRIKWANVSGLTVCEPESPKPQLAIGST
jgi:predicted nucleic acid-binding protein